MDTVSTTKSITFTGRAASIVVSGEDIAQAGGARTGTYDFVVKDAAGNQLAGVTPTADTTKYTSQSNCSFCCWSIICYSSTNWWMDMCCYIRISKGTYYSIHLQMLSVIYSNEFDAALWSVV
jgi:hypothetical protein